MYKKFESKIVEKLWQNYQNIIIKESIAKFRLEPILNCFCIIPRSSILLEVVPLDVFYFGMLFPKVILQHVKVIFTIYLIFEEVRAVGVIFGKSTPNQNLQIMQWLLFLHIWLRFGPYPVILTVHPRSKLKK